MEYQHADFVQNPRKYTLFKTARLVEAIRSSPLLGVGATLQIRYIGTRLNKPRGNVEMPVYEVANGSHPDETSILFACVLGDFCL